MLRSSFGATKKQNKRFKFYTCFLVVVLVYYFIFYDSTLPQEYCRNLDRSVDKEKKCCTMDNLIDVSDESCKLHVPHFQSPPRVTLVVLCHNQIRLTMAAIDSIIDNVTVDGVPFEIILVDDHSQDETIHIEKMITGNIRIYHTPGDTPWLFSRSNNYAVTQMHENSEYVWFLNNDILVKQPGSLSSMLAHLVNDSSIGAVGSLIADKDMNIQEAGSVIYRGGSAMGCGRGELTTNTLYLYSREVDYVSGCSLLMRKSDFIAAGQFNHELYDMYYEDTHLQMMVRYRLKKKIIYEYKSLIQHLQFGSGSMEKAIQRQIKNGIIFEKFWRIELEGHIVQSLDEEQRKFDLLCYCRDRHKTKNILWIDEGILDTTGGGIPRRNRILSAMVEAGYFVTFFGRIIESEYLTWRANIAYIPGVEYELTAADKGRFPKILEAFSKKRVGFYDTVVYSRMSSFIPEKNVINYFPGAYLVFDLESMTSARELKYQVLQYDVPAWDNANESALKRLSDAVNKIVPQGPRMSYDLARSMEEFGMLNTNETLFVTEWEIDLLRSSDKAELYKSKKLSLLDDFYVITATQFAKFEDRRCVLFFGGFHHGMYFNGDAILYYIDHVMPLLRNRVPHNCLNIAGSNIPDVLKSIAKQDPRISILGSVKEKDVKSLMDSHVCMVVPHQYFSGQSSKAIHSLGNGLPIVVSDSIANGFYPALQDHIGDTGILVGYNATEMGDHVVRLMLDKDYWDRQHKGGLNFVKQYLNKDLFMEKVRRVFDSAPRLSKCLR